jgi:hypothetical protein
MSLINFQEHFDNTYQEVFNKVLVGKSIANLRFEKKLKYGESVERFIYDVSGVVVRSTVRGNASTIDTIADSTELLTINLEKEAVFHISDGEVTQAGPLNPGEVIGGQVAIKVATDLDARILGEVVNAGAAFDTGDLTTGISTGVPFTLDSTNVPKAVVRMPAKLRSRNQTLTNLCWVIDSYGASDIEQYLMGKSIDLAGYVFKNGYAGEARNASLIVSENLTGEGILNLSQNVTANDTVTINGVVFTFVASLTSPAVPGEVVAGSGHAASRINLAAALNAPGTTSSTYTAVSAADQAKLAELKITATDLTAVTKVRVRAVGSGRLTLAETLTHADNVWTYNFIHSYFGKKGAIDVVVQDLKKVDMRPTDDRRGTNVFTSYLAGIKTFADGAKKFLDVKINS